MKRNDVDTDIRKALDYLDDLSAQSTPPLTWFEQFVTQQERVRKQRLKREFTLFCGIAPFAIFTVIASLAHGIGTFIVCQSAVLAMLTLYAFVFPGRKKKRGRP